MMKLYVYSSLTLLSENLIHVPVLRFVPPKSLHPDDSVKAHNFIGAIEVKEGVNNDN